MNVIESYQLVDNSQNSQYIELTENTAITYLAHCYAHIQVVAKSLLSANITLSDRFTMLSENFDVSATTYNDTNKVYVEIDNSSNKPTLDIYIPLTAYNAGCAVICITDTNENTEQVTVDFTIAPSVYDSKIERMTLQDNVFEFSASNKIGRIDICESSAVSSEYYNNEYSSDRLMSNGIVNENGHPVYVAQYQTFIPVDLVTEFSDDDALSFSAVNAYLTISNNIQENHYNLNNIDEYTIPTLSADATSAYDCWSYEIISDHHVIEGKVACKTQCFSAYIQKTDVNNDVLRSNTTLAADFVLTGLADKWK